MKNQVLQRAKFLVKNLGNFTKNAKYISEKSISLYFYCNLIDFSFINFANLFLKIAKNRSEKLIKIKVVPILIKFLHLH